MWPIIFSAMRTYSPYILFPVAVVIGAIGYTIENKVIRSKVTPSRTLSIAEEREERFLAQLDKTKDVTQVESLMHHTFVPGAVLDRNKKT